MSAMDRFIARAASQIGYYRRPGSVTLFGQWYGIPTGAWCAMFLSWAADQEGMLGNVIPRHAYTPSGVNWFKARGQWTSGTRGIRRGDLAYFDFAGAPYRVSHVAVVEYVNDNGMIHTIEGNTSGPTGDQRNGGACLRKARKGYIVGYGRPNYSLAENSTKDYLQIGDSGESVASLQRQLIAAGFGVGPSGADGEFGPATQAAVKAFQSSRGLDDDGIAGPLTRTALTSVSAPPVTKPAFHGTPGVHTGRLTSDGNYELVTDGDLGGASISRWQQIMGTPIDGRIDQYPTSSSLIRADQEFLNSVVDPAHIANLDPNQRRRQSHLSVDGFDDFNGTHTSAVRQFWLRNAMTPQHQYNLIGRLLDFDGEFGPQSNTVLQFALNNAVSGSRRYGEV